MSIWTRRNGASNMLGPHPEEHGACACVSKDGRKEMPSPGPSFETRGPAGHAPQDEAQRICTVKSDQTNVPAKPKLRLKQHVAFALPATVSRPALLENGSDDRFRQLVYDLLTVSVRMEAAREHLARRLGVSGPQYSILMAIARLQGPHGVRVGASPRRCMSRAHSLPPRPDGSRGLGSSPRTQTPRIAAAFCSR